MSKREMAMKKDGLRTFMFMSLLMVGCTCFADTEMHTESRMFDLVYARADEVADGLNRSWRGRVSTNGTWRAGEIAVPFTEAKIMVVVTNNHNQKTKRLLTFIPIPVMNTTHMITGKFAQAVKKRQQKKPTLVALQHVNIKQSAPFVAPNMAN